MSAQVPDPANKKADAKDKPGASRSEKPLESPFLSVREVADYLHINTKKVYALVAEGKIPATKVTGKWLFPRKLVDHWLMESSHGGLLTDRLVITGSNDVLIQRAISQLVNEMQGRALISYTQTNTELGLSLLARNRADVSSVRWGPSSESKQLHPALIRSYTPYKNWVLVRVFEREHGLIVSPDIGLPAATDELFNDNIRWVMRNQETGRRGHLAELFDKYQINPAHIHVSHRTTSQQEAASLLARGEADIAAGARSWSSQFGLEFISLGWEAYDFALNRGVYFRALFQRLMEEIQGRDCQRVAISLGGYNFKQCGQIIWSD